MSNESSITNENTSSRFALTRWSVVARAGASDEKNRDRALNDLCTAYWQPIYAFIRSRGHSVESAQDFTQEFLSRWISGPALERADQMRGRFRTFLLTALQDFLIDQHRRDHAQKRGAGVSDVRLDALEMEERMRLEPRTNESPEMIYDQQWAQTILSNAMGKLSADTQRSGRPDFASALLPFATEEMDDGEGERIGEKFGLTKGAVAAALFRMRKKLRDLVREEVAQTTSDDGQLEEEMRHLFASLTG